MAAPPNTIYPQSHVGFDSITSQIEKKLLKRGFQFNVICVGKSLHNCPPQTRLNCANCRGVMLVIRQSVCLRSSSCANMSCAL